MNLGQRMRAAGVDPTAVDYPDDAVFECSRPRHDWIDRLRGLAIVLMVLDHLLVVIDPASPIRLTLTRLAIPLFMFCMAALYRPGLNAKRLAWMAAAAAAELATFPIIGMAGPGIMIGIIAVTVASWRWPSLARHGFAVAVVGFIAWHYLKVPSGVVVAWWGVGRIAPWIEARSYGERLPAFLATIGRHPLGWYIGHLAAIAVLVQAAS